MSQKSFYSVYHCTDEMSMFKPKPELWLGPNRAASYHLVAVVEAVSPAEAFRLTNHIENDWRLNALVRTVTTEPPRSTSVGDVITQGDQKAWLVDRTGFTPLLSEPGPKTVVVNLKTEGYDVYIGRAGKGQSGKWGNPYKSGVHGSRTEVIAKYEQYMLNSPELMKALPELKGKRLGCFCKPLACHGDVLVRLVERLG